MVLRQATQYKQIHAGDRRDEAPRTGQGRTYRELSLDFPNTGVRVWLHPRVAQQVAETECMLAEWKEAGLPWRGITAQQAGRVLERVSRQG